MLLAVFCVTIMSVQAKLIGIEFNAVQITFARAIVVLILLMPLIYKLGGLDFLKTKKPFLHFFRGLAGLIGNVMFFLAYQRLPVADVTVISQAVPIFSCILAIIFLGETIGWRRWTAITIGFLGVIIAINPSVNHTLLQHATGMNIARNGALWAGCPVTTSGTTINRFCSSGLQVLCMAAPVSRASVLP